MYHSKLARNLVVGLANGGSENLRCTPDSNFQYGFARLLENDVFYIKSKAGGVCYTNAFNSKRQINEIPTPQDSEQPTSSATYNLLVWLLVCLSFIMVVLFLAVYLTANPVKAAEFRRKCRKTMTMGPLASELSERPKSLSTDSEAKAVSGKTKTEETGKK